MTLRLTLVLALVTASTFADSPVPESIFDGKTLAGWEGSRQQWRVEDGAITGEIPVNGTLTRNEFIYWQGDVHDFELVLEYRITGDPTLNSGIQFRSQRLADGQAAGYQADLDDGTMWLGRIYDEHGRKLLAERGTRGSIAPDGRRWTDTFAKPEDFRPEVKHGDWNTYRIVASGPHLELWVNGTLWSTVDDHQSDAAEYSGKLALQLHSGKGPAKVQFRNIRLAHHGRTELPRAIEPVGLKPVGADGKPLLERAVAVAVHGGDPARPNESPVLWHLRRNPAKPTTVKNAAAQKLVADMLLTPGFQAELIAAEPDVHQPIAFAIDERGRLWVVEAHTYPTKAPGGKGKDRVVIFEDADGDGAFETRKVFVEGLNLVSGIEVGFGGVWIGAAPELLFFPDRNHDDKPDGPPQVLLDGWGFQDTHETLNSFTWGPDGWLYGNQGVFVTSKVGPPGTAEDQRQSLRAGVWRYHPVRHAFEIFSHGGSNQWGIDFNEHGHLFLTHCRSFHGGGGTTFAIRNGYFWNQANSHYPNFISNSAPSFAPAIKNFLPAAARYDSGEGGAGKPGTTAIYGGHSHVGTLIYLGDNWPDAYRNHLFTHNLHGHQVNHQVNVRTGSAYETFHAGFDLLHASDPTYVPVDLQTGPDGAVYVIDWTDRQHCHTPHEERWDRTNGRIYRVSWAQTYRPLAVDLGRKSDVELAQLHMHKSEWFVRTARRLLQERAAAGKIVPAAVEELRAQIKAAGANATATLRALWTLHVTDGLGPAGIEEMLGHASDAVRAWGVQLATETSGKSLASAAKLSALAQSDPSALVRLAIASALPALPAEERWDVIGALAAHAGDADDRFLPRMIWFGLASVAAQNVDRAMAIANRSPLLSLRDSTRWYVARTARGRDLITAELARASDEVAARELRLLAFSIQNETTLPAPGGWADISRRFASHPDRGVRATAEQLSAVFGDRGVLAELRARLANGSVPLAERKLAFEALKRVSDREAVPLYIPLLENDAFRSAVIPLLAGTDEPAAAAGVLRHFSKLNEVDRVAALNTLASRAAPALALLDAVQTQAFEKKQLTALHIRQMRNLSDPRVNQRLDEVWGKVGESSAAAKNSIARWKQTYEAAPLWAYSAKAGESVYQRACAACHARDGQGGKLGPDLAGSWRNGVDYFLENIIDPNAVVGADYQLNVVTKRDGTVVSGMIERQSETAVLVRTITELVTVPLNQIKSREVSSQSMMPPGLLETLSERETIELLKFLTTRN